MSGATLAALGLLLSAPLFAASQSVPAHSVSKQPASSATVLKVTSRLIYVDVVVRDGSGQPVRNLTERDLSSRMFRRRAHLRST